MNEKTWRHVLRRCLLQHSQNVSGYPANVCGIYFANIRKKMMADAKHQKGTLSELVCQQELVREGYDVFTPITGHGPVDIVAIHPETGNIRLIDVKTLSRRRDGTRIYRTPSVPQKKIGVEVIEIDLFEALS